MTAEGHEMESVSSVGKDDDPTFVPKLIEKRRRTGSFLQKAKSAVTNRVLPTIKDPQVVQDGTLALDLRVSHDCDAHVPPKICFYENVRTGSYSR
jgi:hypothetical protein